MLVLYSVRKVLTRSFEALRISVLLRILNEVFVKVRRGIWTQKNAKYEHEAVMIATHVADHLPEVEALADHYLLVDVKSAHVVHGALPDVDSV